MSTTQTKKLSEATVVQSIADADKIPIVNSSGLTVLVPLSGLLGAVKVGGRNIVPGTKTGLGWISEPGADGVFSVSTAAPSETYIHGPIVPYQEGKTYTASFWMKTTANIVSVDFFRAAYARAEFNLQPSVNWVKIVHTFTWDRPDNTEVRLRFDNNGSTDGNTATLWIKELKIEEGNIATAWSPAFEDYQLRGG